jgi:hypothetical protein
MPKFARRAFVDGSGPRRERGTLTIGFDARGE